MNPDSEIQLVEAAKNGDIESFGALYRCYYSAMAALAYSMLDDKDLANDAAQETFAAACDKIGSLKSKEKFSAWLAGICRNISRQMLKAKKTKMVSLDNDYPDKDEDALGNRRDMIRQAVRQLCPEERELIVLRYYDNLPYERIASVLDISVQAVNGRLVRTKRKIAKYLKCNGLTGDDYEKF